VHVATAACFVDHDAESLAKVRLKQRNGEEQPGRARAHDGDVLARHRSHAQGKRLSAGRGKEPMRNARGFRFLGT
jgi:hypothetical protein